MTPEQQAALSRWVHGEPVDEPTTPPDEPDAPTPQEGWTRPTPEAVDLVAVRLRLQEALSTQQGGTEALSLDRWATREEAWADAVGCVLEANTLGGAMADMTQRMRHISEARKQAEGVLRRMYDPS